MKNKRKLPASKPAAATATAAAAKRPRWSLYILAAILLLVIAAYANMLRNDLLTFDDNDYFQMYPEVTRLSWESVRKFFSGYYLIMYQPLPVLTFALNYHASGLSTYPMHWISLFLHMANIVLVYLFASRLTGNRTTALLAALLFGIHPMNVEAVSWISARSSGMYSLFYLSALIFYLDYLHTKKPRMLLATGLFFVLSLFSKAQAVTLPVVMVLLDYFFVRDLKKPAPWLEKIPFFTLSIVFGLVTLADPDTRHNITQGMMISYSPVDMPFLLSYSLVFYVVKLFLPLSLCAVYVYPPKTGGFLPWEYYASLPVLGFLLWLLWKNRNHRWVVLGAGFFLITISINLQIIPSRLFIVTERYGYVPYIGLFLLILTGIEKFRQREPHRYTKRRTGLIAFGALFVVASVVIVVNRNKVWASDIPFLSDIIKKNPEVPYMYRAYGNRGLAYKSHGQFPEALNDMTKAIAINPEDGRSYYNRALVQVGLKNYSAAAVDMDEAVKRDTTQPLLYRDRSQLRLLISDTTGAEQDAARLLSLQAGNPDALNVLATIAFARLDFENADKHLTEAVTKNPGFSLGFKNRGLLYIRMNRKADACSDFIQASNLGNEDAKQLSGQYCK